jgi:Tol biopolymer transport system component
MLGLFLPVVLLGAVASAAGPPPEAAIVFASDLTPWSSGEIYRLDLDGRRVNLSRSPADDTDPLISPDGTHVAFVSDRGMVDGNRRVFVVSRDGTGLRAVSSPIERHQYSFGGDALAWSRDSRRLVFGGVDSTDRASSCSSRGSRSVSSAAGPSACSTPPGRPTVS